MIAALAIAAGVAASAPPPRPPAPTLADTAHAIAVGRLEQSRLMISRMVADGAKGPAIDRLIADLDFAAGRYAEAGARYQQLLQATPKDSYLCEHAGIAAFHLGDLAGASRLIDCATAAPDASWRAWNARGAIADMKSDWAAADDAFEHATALAPNQAEVLNNRGWSLLMRGNWKDAEALFEQAVASHPESPRVANNLELARAALASALPQRLPGESDRDWAARLNDTGVASEILGNKTKAVAAFTQALEASGSWYERAANNLKAAERGE
ncbi:MAG TPA: tetratricopeptide repeat protein [Sphingomicrobium sp.]|nr:tetratricopeptide repeat protein [Sphingomicrobium sp.]